MKFLTEKQAVETTLTPRIHQLDTQTQKEVTLKTRPHEETISKNTSNGSKSVPHSKLYKSVKNDTPDMIIYKKARKRRESLTQAKLRN